MSAHPFQNASTLLRGSGRLSRSLLPARSPLYLHVYMSTCKQRCIRARVHTHTRAARTLGARKRNHFNAVQKVIVRVVVSGHFLQSPICAIERAASSTLEINKLVCLSPLCAGPDIMHHSHMACNTTFHVRDRPVVNAMVKLVTRRCIVTGVLCIGLFDN